VSSFILNTKENKEVFSFCDEFGNNFRKKYKKSLINIKGRKEF
jgi:hypothetical protein